MDHEITLDDAIDFAPSTEVEEILQNVRTILSTRIGTVPLHRDFGLTWEHIDKPYQVARSLMQAEIIDAIEEYEPRARIKSVTFNDNAADAMEGLLKPRVVISTGEDTEDE